MDQGHVVTVGTPAEVLEHPEVVSAYLGTGTTRAQPIRTARADPATADSTTLVTDTRGARP